MTKTMHRYKKAVGYIACDILSEKDANQSLADLAKHDAIKTIAYAFSMLDIVVARDVRQTYLEFRRSLEEAASV